MFNVIYEPLGVELEASSNLGANYQVGEPLLLNIFVSLNYIKIGFKLLTAHSVIKVYLGDVLSLR